MNEFQDPQVPARDRFDVLRVFDAHGGMIARITLVITSVVALGALLYLVWGQPTLRTVLLEFRPTFAGAAEGKYPNELPFGPGDITAGQVMDQVFDSNGIGQYCDRNAFKEAIFVEQKSAQLSLLDAEFQSRLSDARLNAVDREGIQQEYYARRKVLPLQYQLVFVMPRACERLPPVLVSKVLADVLAIWAQQSEARRGVLKMQVQVLTPNVLEVGLREDGARLIRADLIRTALRRLVANVQAVEERPGAALLRLGAEQVTFAEVRTKLGDLIQARLEPLIVLAGRGLGSASFSWVDEALAVATQQRDAAQGRAAEYLRALREYSGALQTPSAAPAAAPSSDVQSLTPQIDRTFIDRIVEMSETNIEFRQELTRGIVEAGIVGVDHGARVAYYQHLAASLRDPRGGGLTAAEVDARLGAIINDGKALVKQFNDLYDEWSKVALRPSAEMYQVVSPVRTEVSRAYTTRSWLFTVMGTLLITLFASIVIFLLRDHFAEIRLRREDSSR